MASIERDTARGTYSVRYRTPSGTQSKKRGFKTKRDAQMWLASTEVKKATGEFVKPSHGRVTVDELWAERFARREQVLAATTKLTYEHIYRNHVGPRWGATPVARIGVLDVEDWVTAMGAGGCGAALVRRAHTLLCGVLDDAVRTRRIPANPARAVTNLPPIPGQRHVFLTEDDVARLATEAARCAPTYGVLVLVLAYTGIRWGEATALRVSDIDVAKRRLSITRSAVRVGSTHVVKAPKSGKPRWVPVPAFVLLALQGQCIDRSGEDLVFPHLRTGGFMVQAGRDSWFAGAVRRSGVQDISPHDLRHTCASLSHRIGIPVGAISRMLGHAKVSITVDIYTDLFDTDLDTVGERIDAHYAASHSVPNPCPRGVGEGS